jgi:competence protein ComEA
MKFSCIRVTVFFGGSSTLQVEAGNTAAEVDSASSRFFINPADSDPIPVVVEVLGKLKTVLEDPAGNAIEIATSGRFLTPTPTPAVAPTVAAAAAKAVPKPPVGGPSLVDINSASESELETLPGVGPEIARRIVAARPFKTVNDLLKVSGIGDIKLADISGRVSLG